jgi:aldehyde dehydrogenase (NAD+)
LPLVGELKHSLSHLKRWMKPLRISPTLATARHHVAASSISPKGRCLVISPWNYPLSLALGPLVSAVAAGNTVVLKPSEFTPHTNGVVKDIIGAVFAPNEVASSKAPGGCRHRTPRPSLRPTSSSRVHRRSGKKVMGGGRCQS